MCIQNIGWFTWWFCSIFMRPFLLWNILAQCLYHKIARNKNRSFENWFLEELFLERSTLLKKQSAIFVDPENNTWLLTSRYILKEWQFVTYSLLVALLNYFFSENDFGTVYVAFNDRCRYLINCWVQKKAHYGYSWRHICHF